jgi:hypothetical protein
MKRKNVLVLMTVSSLLCITSFSSQALANVIITDNVGDVYSQDYLTEEWTVITDHPDINVDNLDFVQMTYTQQGTQATVSLQVNGTIENRDHSSGNLFEYVSYYFNLETSEQYYYVNYCNRTGTLYRGGEQINLTTSDFSVVGDTLTITFPLLSADERYKNLEAESYYRRVDYSGEEISVTYLADIAPNHPLTVWAYSSSIGYVGGDIEFHGYVDFLSGHSPYTYSWDFGDGSSSTQREPKYTYTEAGDYTYTLTVTDNAGDTKNDSGTITIMILKKAFLFGSFDYINTGGDYIQVDAANLRMILFNPFQILHYTYEHILLTSDYKGVIISNKFLIGLFNVLIEPD